MFFKPVFLGIFDAAELLKTLLNKLVNILPGVVAAFAVFVIGWILSKVVRRVLQIAIEAAGIDKIAQKLMDVEFIQQTKINIKPSRFISQLVSYVLLLVFTIASTDLLGMPAISQLMSDLINYIPNIFSAIILLAIGIAFADMIKKLAVTTFQSLGISGAKMIGQVIFFFLVITIFVSALAQAKIDTAFMSANLTVLLGAGAAAFAFGYGLASRDLISNFLAGYYSRTKIRRGDIIGIDGVRGEVVATDSASLTIWTGEHHVVVPMSKLTTEKLEIFHGPGNPDLPKINESVNK
jgi:small-conductance mechanosensitive channel